MAESIPPVQPMINPPIYLWWGAARAVWEIRICVSKRTMPKQKAFDIRRRLNSHNV